MPPTRDDMRALDAGDPLAAMRDRFLIADPDLIYLDGNSLGRLPQTSRERLHHVVDAEWGGELVRGWHHWIEEPERVGDVLASHVLGAEPGEVLVADSTTVNLFKLAVAAATMAREHEPARSVLVTTASNFPTDRYVFEGVARLLGMSLRLLPHPRAGEALDLRPALQDDVALLCLSHVDYVSGELFDMTAATARAAEAGVRVLWDLSHSAGSVPLSLETAGAELAVGCTYKYLNGGPGAPAYLYVRTALQEQLRSPIWGWFGQQDQFAMGQGYVPARGIRRFGAGTAPVLGLALVEEGARLIGEAGVETLAAKSAAFTALIVDLADAWLASWGFSVVAPREPARRGAHVSLAHPEAYPICRALIESAGVVPDYRAAPDGSGTIRLGPAPLYTRYVDVWDAMARLRDIASSGAYRGFAAEPGRVT